MGVSAVEAAGRSTLRGDRCGLEMLDGRHPSLDFLETGGRRIRPCRLAALI